MILVAVDCRLIISGRAEGEWTARRWDNKRTAVYAYRDVTAVCEDRKKDVTDVMKTEVTAVSVN